VTTFYYVREISYLMHLECLKREYDTDLKCDRKKRKRR